jgi:hypothetical protein
VGWGIASWKRAAGIAAEDSVDMNRLIVTAAVLTVLGGALAACETATPYQPLHAGGQTPGGYADTRIEADRWRVSFKGNDETPREVVETYLLYRAADLTAAQGYDWFEPVDRHTDKRVEVDPGFYGGFGYGYGYGWGGGYWRRFGYAWGPYWGDPYWGGDVSQRYSASAEIVMGHYPKPQGDLRAMDAREVMKNLRGHLVLPK